MSYGWTHLLLYQRKNSYLDHMVFTNLDEIIEDVFLAIRRALF